MEWIKIDKKNLPKGNVLAANFKPNTEDYKVKIFGKISLDKDIEGEYIICENFAESVFHITHWYPINDHDIEP
ncbi:hypothetical protein LCGC14_3046460 [marine sediment metagenome]|uniref:DUF551 domain-containing protein n=2 Tax=root TaxID=1 RepID=A0A831QQR2_9FLAO|nr:hypothetical protein [Pricia antarctica]